MFLNNLSTIFVEIILVSNRRVIEWSPGKLVVKLWYEFDLLVFELLVFIFDKFKFKREG